MNKPRSLRAFTLIELLVVISIIALLVSILLPALGRARKQAQAVACLSHLQQVAIALTMYLHDNDNYLPPYTDLNAGAHNAPESWESPDGVVYTQYRRHILTTEWFKSGPYSGAPRDGDGLLAKYLSTQEDSLTGILGCPSIPEGPVYKNLAHGGVSAKFPVYHGRSYAQSLWAVRQDAGHEYEALKISKIKKVPSEFVPICDGAGTIPFVYGAWADPDDYSAYTPEDRHNGRFNACFLDGHADSGTHEELYNYRHFHPTLYTEP